MSFFKNTLILFLQHSLPYIYKGKDNNKSVNIFYKSSYRITHYVSMHYKTYAFATPKLNYYFSTKLFLQSSLLYRKHQCIRLH